MSKTPRSPDYVSSPAHGQAGEDIVGAIDQAFDDEHGYFETRATHVPGAGFAPDPYQPRRPASSVNVGSKEPLFVPEEPPIPLSAQGLASLAPARRRRPSTIPPTQRSGVSKTRRKVKIRGEEFITSQTWNTAKSNSPDVHSGFLNLLKRILQNIDTYAKMKRDRTPSNSSNMGNLLKALRDDIASAPLHKSVTKAAITNSGFMGALKRIEGLDLPEDVVDDILAVWRRWNTGNIDPGITRGLTVGDLTNNTDRTSRLVWSLEVDYQFKIPGNAPGSNGLQNGQWWPYQLAALRDGAVGTSQAGITTNAEHGAVAIVITTSIYKDDTDRGTELWYSGTYAKGGDLQEVTKATRAMDIARDRKTPVRVLRSSGAKKDDNKYLPAYGMRYDGLYNVVDRDDIDKDAGRYRFKLVRIEGQSPLRHEGIDARPNGKEIEAFKEMNEMKKIKR